MDIPKDRRVRRTRHALQQAMLGLLARADYDAITVAQICEAADVGRSAFYQHFKGKDDLLRSGFAQLEADLEVSEPHQAADFSARFLDHAYRHRALYRSLMRSLAAPIATTAIRRILDGQARAVLARETPSGAPQDLRAALLVDLLLSLTRWWLDRDARQPIRDIDAMFKELSAGIIGAGRPPPISLE